MKFYSALMLCALCLFVAVSCQKAHDAVLRTKLMELDLTRLNLTVDEQTRKKNFDTLARQLTAEYPPAPPFGKDSTDRIFRPNHPATLDGMPFMKTSFGYYLPTTKSSWHDYVPDKKYISMKYFGGGIGYFRQGKKTKDNRGLAINVTDTGHIPEWAVTWEYDKLFKGEPGELFAGMHNSFDFDRTTTYNGHKWAIWIENERAKKKNTGGTSVSVFGTQWNSRFIVLMYAADTTTRQIENFYKLVDVEWLDKLKSPDRAH